MLQSETKGRPRPQSLEQGEQNRLFYVKKKLPGDKQSRRSFKEERKLRPLSVVKKRLSIGSGVKRKPDEAGEAKEMEKMGGMLHKCEKITGENKTIMRNQEVRKGNPTSSSWHDWKGHQSSVR